MDPAVMIILVTVGIVIFISFLSRDDSLIGFAMIVVLILLMIALFTQVPGPKETIVEEEVIVTEETIPPNMVAIRSGDTLYDVSTEKFYLYNNGKFYEEVK